MLDIKWIADLKPGDQVIVVQSGIGRAEDRRSVASVVRVTERQLVVTVGPSEYKFRRDTGNQVGGDTYHYKSIQQATEETIAEVKRENRRRRMISFLSSFDFNRLSDEDLETVFAPSYKIHALNQTNTNSTGQQT